MLPRIHASRNIAGLLFVSVWCLTLSCRSPVLNQGGASLSLALGGALIPTRVAQPARAGQGGSRVLIPSITTAMRVVAVDPSGRIIERSLELADIGASITLEGLPVGVELDMTVEARAADGSVVTAWNGKRTLALGANELSVTLTPQASAERVLSLGGTAAELPRRASTASLARGAVRFEEAAGLPPGLEAQLLYDTDRAEYTWLGAYDSSWEPLPLIASDQARGWVVVEVPADGIVRTAVANVASSPGYPERAVAGGLHVRQAFFCGPNADGGGRHDNPAPLVEGNDLTARNGWSVFLREGTYTLTTTLLLDNESLYVYGGFPSSDWKTRAASTARSVLQGASAQAQAVEASGSVDCRLDGLSILGRSSGDSSWGFLWASAGRLIISDCDIGAGSIASTLVGGTTGLRLDSTGGGIEIASSSISGDATSSSTDNNQGISTGIFIYASTVSPYIHTSDINGGSASSSGANATVRSYGIHINGTGTIGAVIAACRIWGGIVTSGSTPLAEAYGIIHSGNDRLYLISSLVSGGFCSTANFVVTGVNIASDRIASILGCTVDGGCVDPAKAATGQSSAIQEALTSPMSTRIQGCALFSSSPAKNNGGDDIPRLGLYIAGSTNAIDRVSGSSFFAADAGFYNLETRTSLQELGAVTALNNSGNAATLASSQFRSYAAAPRTFADFLAVDWRPAAGAAYVGSSSGENGFSEAGLTPQLLADYPALGLDLAGRPRPATGPWARGAYEP